MNPFATPEGSAGDVSVAGSLSPSKPPLTPSGGPVSGSSVMSGTESQPTLRDFPHPPTKNPVRVGRPPRAVAWSDKLSIASAKEKYTFYREGTPPPPEDRITRPPLIAEESAYDYKYDHIAPPAPIPVATICGVRRRIFWIILAAVLLVVALAVGIGVGVGVGTSRRSSSSPSDAQASGSSVTTTTIISTSPTSDLTPTTTSISTSTITEPETTSETTSASTVSANPAITTLTSCPSANDTIFKVPGADKQFLRICGVDYTGKNSAEDLAHAWTPTFEDCMILCAGFPDCEGCGWGVLKGDPGSYHRCWLKGNLKTSHTARIGWDFAILQ